MSRLIGRNRKKRYLREKTLREHVMCLYDLQACLSFPLVTLSFARNQISTKLKPETAVAELILKLSTKINRLFSREWGPYK